MARELAMTTRGKQEPTLPELCYFAGVMDSDGCFYISKAKAGTQKTANPRYVFGMVVTNTSKILMEWLIERFGGYCVSRPKVSERHKTTYNWSLSNGRSFWILKLVEPHLIIKGPQARVGIALLKGWTTAHRGPNGRGNKTDPAEVARREESYQAMKRLNQVGTVQPQRLSVLAPTSVG